MSAPGSTSERSTAPLGAAARAPTIDLAMCLSRLSRWRGRPELGSDPATLLELAALPALEPSRPQRWHTLDQTIAALLEHNERARR